MEHGTTPFNQIHDLPRNFMRTLLKTNEHLNKIIISLIIPNKDMQLMEGDNGDGTYGRWRSRDLR